MADKVYIEGVGLQDLTTEEQTAFDARRAANAPWRMELLRVERNKLLAETDWVVTKHTEAGTTIPTEWVTYRQALRDITDNYSNLNDVEWPEKPSG